MKKILLSLSILSLLLGFTQAFDTSDCQEKMFTVTAYYSPESNQTFYYKPTFLDEVILNGEGYTGASGKKVFNGMLAAPATYEFGSMIYFPELGVGEVADRGGAIVLSGERGQNYDRIDIWMGRGEEGLVKALTFGKKNMTGYLCTSSASKKNLNVGLNMNAITTPKYFFDAAIRIQSLKAGRKDIRVWTLQKYLNKLGYLDFKHRHGDYNTYTKQALCRYQVAKKIVGSKHPDCGTFGPITRYTMKLDVQKKGLLPTNLYEAGTITAITDLSKYYNGRPQNMETLKDGNMEKLSSTSSEIIRSKSSDIFHFYRAYTKGQQSSEIKILQQFLTDQGLYSAYINGIYDKNTTNALYEFQKKYGLISDTDALALRGYLGPKTRAKINEMRK